MNMQKQKPIWSKILAMLCALALCISMVPAASAAPGGGSSTSSVSQLTITKDTGILGFATYNNDITNIPVTENSVKYQLVEGSLVVTPASGNYLPTAITFYAQAEYQPTITAVDGITVTVSVFNNNWWAITVNFGSVRTPGQNYTLTVGSPTL